MPRTCLACAHTDRAAIDKALAAGEPLRNIAKRVSISHAALFRHKSHVKETIDELRGAKSFSSLPPQKQKYVEGVAEGKTKVQAALDAGYSAAMARSATHNIETPDVRAAFTALMRKRIPPEKIVQRIEEGMDAMETKFFQKDGKVEEKKEVIAWSERREYTAMAAEYGGYHVPPSRDEGRAQLQIAIGVKVIGGENAPEPMLIDVTSNETDVSPQPVMPAVTSAAPMVETPTVAVADDAVIVDDRRPNRAECQDDKEYTDKMAQWFIRHSAGKRASPTIVAVPPEQK